MVNDRNIHNYKERSRDSECALTWAQVPFRPGSILSRASKLGNNDKHMPATH